MGKIYDTGDRQGHPQIEGALIRLPIPPLTEERRKDLVKVVKKYGEEARVAVRNVRRDANERFKKLEKEHKISEDELHTRQEEVQKITDRFIKEVDEVVEGKEKEIMEV
jgi:ribosome recycling factor